MHSSNLLQPPAGSPVHVTARPRKFSKSLQKQNPVQFRRDLVPPLHCSRNRHQPSLERRLFKGLQHRQQKRFQRGIRLDAPVGRRRLHREEPGQLILSRLELRPGQMEEDPCRHQQATPSNDGGHNVTGDRQRMEIPRPPVSAKSPHHPA